MKKRFITFVLIIPVLAGLLLLSSIPNFSKKANDESFSYFTEDVITIDKTIHDFGTISESGGNVSTTFTITNNTKAPVVITNVITSCGCTTREWTKKPIETGKKGKVTATFNPKNRPGAFEKTVTILTTGNPEKIIVRIKGTVEF